MRHLLELCLPKFQEKETLVLESGVSGSPFCSNISSLLMWFCVLSFSHRLSLWWWALPSWALLLWLQHCISLQDCLLTPETMLLQAPTSLMVTTQTVVGDEESDKPPQKDSCFSNVPNIPKVVVWWYPSYFRFSLQLNPAPIFPQPPHKHWVDSFSSI